MEELSKEDIEILRMLIKEYKIKKSRSPYFEYSSSTGGIIGSATNLTNCNCKK